MIENWWENAISQPWPFVALGLAWIIYRFGKWLSIHLLDEEKGVITKHLNSIAEDSKSMKDAIVEVAKTNSATLATFQHTILESLDNNRLAIESLEKQLVSAIQAAPNDEELFDVLFNKNPIPIAFVGENHVFTRVNAACEELWGYSIGELSSMRFEDLTANESDLESDIYNVNLVMSGARKRYRMEKSYICKDGSQKKCALYVFRYPGEGAFLHFISIIIPI